IRVPSQHSIFSFNMRLPLFSMNSERARSLTDSDSRFTIDPENDSENSASRHPLIAVERVYSVRDRGSAAAELLLNGFEDYGQHQAQTVLSHARYAGFPTFNGRGGSTESQIDLLKFLRV